eukprot:1715002-Rhodomonas_salina.2
MKSHCTCRPILHVSAAHAAANKTKDATLRSRSDSAGPPVTTRKADVSRYFGMSLTISSSLFGLCSEHFITQQLPLAMLETKVFIVDW